MVYNSFGDSDTIDIAAAFGRTLSKGDIVLLEGDLGAGKTTFAKGIIKALGVDKNVTSPTFTIANEYHAKDMTIYHMDAYRLDGVDIQETGLQDCINDSKGISIIEWSKYIDYLLQGKKYITVSIQYVDATTRVITIDD